MDAVEFDPDHPEEYQMDTGCEPMDFCRGPWICPIWKNATWMCPGILIQGKSGGPIGNGWMGACLISFEFCTLIYYLDLEKLLGQELN
jgi:hypothetical protein